MEYETMVAEEEAQNEVVFSEDSCEELERENWPIPGDMEDQLYEEWRDNNGTSEDSQQ